MREITKKKWETEEFRERFIEGMKKATKITPNKVEIKMIKMGNFIPNLFSDIKTRKNKY